MLNFSDFGRTNVPIPAVKEPPQRLLAFNCNNNYPATLPTVFPKVNPFKAQLLGRKYYSSLSITTTPGLSLENRATIY